MTCAAEVCAWTVGSVAAVMSVGCVSWWLAGVRYRARYWR